MKHADEIAPQHERKTGWVILLTLATMFAEILYGYITHSMALLADGLHMGTHALALGLTLAAYILIRKFNHSVHFPHGTDKIGTLAAYSSSLFLGATGIWIIAEAIYRLLVPVQIQFNEALCVAFIGLAVNALCILIMGKHPHAQPSPTADYNFLAAYYHILADALTSVLAIIALWAGKYFHLSCLDAIMGILGGILILKWAAGLIKSTVCHLLDIKTV